MRPGERDELVVGVDGLGLFVGSDGDGGERGDEEPRIEDAFDDGQDVGMYRDLLEGLPVDQQVVDPRGVQALEEVGRRHDAEVAFELEQRLVDFVDELWFDDVVEDGVPVLGDIAQVLLEIRERAGGGAGGVRGGVAAGLAGSHVVNCTAALRLRVLVPARAELAWW